jgi:threonine dehydratase
MVNLDDIERAAGRVRGLVRRTPTVRVAPLRVERPYDVYAKLECLQVTGSFKPRGALNKLLSLDRREVGRGVVTASGGNHGLGVAYAARHLGVPATVFVPERASAARRARLADWGAEVVVHGRDWDDSYAAARDLAERGGLPLVHAFDDPAIAAGQGTVGVELLADAGAELDAVIVPVGGGGLLTGVATAVKAARPGARVVGVEPEGAAGLTASLAAGRVVELASVDTIADTLAPRRAGELALEAARRHVDDVVLVSDDELRRAMRAWWDELNLLVEPAGAASLAALLSGRAGVEPGARVGLVVSGANLGVEPAIGQFEPAARISQQGTQ